MNKARWACMKLQLLACAVAGVWCGSALGQSTPIAFTNARVLTATGLDIQRGTVLIEDGKIVDVGDAGMVEIPAGARRIDLAGKTIIPGLVDTHSHIGGVGGADSSSPIQPSVRVSDSINVLDSGFRRAVAGGLTTMNIMPGSGHLLSGQTVYVKLRMGDVEAGAGEAGRGPVTIEDLTLRGQDGTATGGIKMANGTNPMRAPPFAATRGKAAALVREAYIRAQEYQTKIGRANGDAAKLPARDLGLEALGQAIEGTKIVHHHTHRADDIMTVLRLREEFGFRVVLQHVSEAWKVAPEIAAAQNAGGVLGCSIILVDSPGGKLEASQLNMETGAILERAGVRVAFHTDDWITDARYFARMAALGVRNGMTREGALRALTINGAYMLDLADRVGSLEPGKDADLVVLSGDPFSVYTRVEQTWVEGAKVFDLSRPEDQLHADGGYGAGRDQEPYFCCFGN